jgi:hypothetical protein
MRWIPGQARNDASGTCNLTPFSMAPFSNESRGLAWGVLGVALFPVPD